MSKPVNYIIDADIKGFFDNVNHDWIMKFLQERITDPNLLRIIKRFLIAGIMEKEEYKETDKGTPQGGIISPILTEVDLNFMHINSLWRLICARIKLKTSGKIMFQNSEGLT